MTPRSRASRTARGLSLAVLGVLVLGCGATGDEERVGEDDVSNLVSKLTGDSDTDRTLPANTTAAIITTEPPTTTTPSTPVSTTTTAPVISVAVTTTLGTSPTRATVATTSPRRRVPTSTTPAITPTTIAPTTAPTGAEPTVTTAICQELAPGDVSAPGAGQSGC